MDPEIAALMELVEGVKVEEPVVEPYQKEQGFPYKSLFILTPPLTFVENLKKVHALKLVNLQYNRRFPFPIKLISDPKVYDKVNIITDLFTEEARMKAKVFSNPSPYEVWERDFERLQQYAMARFGNISTLSIREAIYLTSKEATTFSPVISKCIYDLLLPSQGGHVLDPFSGWGDRAIGTLGSEKVLSYQGVDCNSALVPGYNRIIEELDSKKIITFTNSAIEDFKSEKEYDLIFSSPPYFDFELYSDDPRQSNTGMGTYQDWYTKWMEPVLFQLIGMLKKGGYFAFHVGTTYRTPSFPDDMKRTLKPLLKFIQRIDCSVGKQRGIPIWIYRKE